MFEENDPKTEIWQCDPLVVTDAGEEIIFADQAAVEFEPLTGPDIIGHAVILNADEGPPIEIDIRSKRSQPNLALGNYRGKRGGFALYGMDRNGSPVAWHIGGAADLYVTIRERALNPNAVRYQSLVVRDLATGEIQFSGAANVMRSSATAVEDLFKLRAQPDTEHSRQYSVEVRESKRLWPSLLEPHFGEISVGRDRDGKAVEWVLRH